MNKLFFFLLILCFQCTPSDNTNDKNHKPDLNRFEIELVADNLDQPMSMEILEDGRIFFVEKEGAIKMVDPETFKVRTIGEIPVNERFSVPFTTSGSKYDADDGMHGIALDPDFTENGFIYLYYSPDTEEPISQVVRYTFKDGSMDLNSKKVLLEWETQRERCCHWGGGMVFDQDKNLLIATGDNSGFNMNMETGDSRRSSGNTNDLRGSILRIKPNNDGTYSIPNGNLFPKGTTKTRPEIYIMGVRNPWRLSMDSQTGWMFWGEVGPSTDEFNLAKEAGNFGWPYFMANNVKNNRVETDFDTNRIINESQYNTGLTELPTPPVPALAWYDRNPSEAFPIPGSGSLSAVGGPVFRKADFNSSAKRVFPSYYEGKWFVTDYVRGWILTIEVDESGQYKSMEEFMPESTFKGINDMDFGPGGDLYVLQYGHDSYASYASDSKLFRIKFNGGNRKPVAKAAGNNTSGSIPLDVELNAHGTVDFDNNISHYEWNIASNSGESQSYKGVNPVARIEEEGLYQAILTVTDSEGAQNTDTLEIIAGNNAPEIDIDFKGSNKSFYFPEDLIRYSIDITDQEDDHIDDSRVKTWSDFMPAGYSAEEVLALMAGATVNMSARALLGESLVKQNNCYQCHTIDRTAVGPSYTEVANKYRTYHDVYQSLSDNIISGSIGTWGQVEMPAHPAISQEEARLIVDFILEASDSNFLGPKMPLEGSITVPSQDSEIGDMVFKVSYKDLGKEQLPPIETVHYEILRNPTIYISDVDTFTGMRVYIPHFKQLNHLITNKDNAFIGIQKVDLTGIQEVGLEIIGLEKLADSDWEVSVRTGSSSGTVLGSSKFSEVDMMDDKIAKVTLASLSGENDLYIVFSYNQAGDRPIEVEIRSVQLYK